MKLYSTPTFALAFAVVLAASPAAAQPTSDNSKRLKRALQQFPAADTDKDGILTMTEARAWLARNRSAKGRMQNDTIFTPTPEELEAAVARGRELARGNAPLAFEKRKGLRILTTGHSWVAPGLKTLPAIAAAAGYADHRQRHHTSGGGTGAANAIWLKEFGKWEEGSAANPILLPAIVTGDWDVMTWGSFYEDKPAYYTQWIDLCLKHNPEMVFYVQDGWPRFDPAWKPLAPEEIRKAVDAEQAKIQSGLYKKSPAAIEGYAPAGIPPAFDQKMREAAWRAIVASPYAGVDDANGDSVAD